MKKEWGKSFSVEDKELEALSQQNIKKPNEGKSVKKITFVFPDVPHVLSGGLKMVLEYANRLTARKYEVQIAFDCHVGIHDKRRFIPLFLKKNILYPLLIRYHPRWFSLNPKVKKVLIKDKICDEEIPDADVIIATAVRTAEPVSRLSASKGKKFFFIQGFENWSADWPAKRVESTYHLGMKNIVVAKWLEKKLKSVNADCVLIPNSIDFDVFNIDVPIKERKTYVISMLYHEAPLKGAKYGIEALKKLKKIYPKLEVKLFGVFPRPQSIPSWMHYTRNASEVQLRGIYNSSTIYMCPSIAESFGLPGAEAMACGAAYVASDYGGVHEYATDGRNALLSPPRSVEGLVKNVSYLFDYPEERIRMAETGYQDIQRLDWEKTLDKFERVIQS